MNELQGFLFSKLDNIGSRSEGPVYFLQQFDLKELPILKKVNLWEEDPVLQKHIATKVTLLGNLKEGKIDYENVFEYKPVLVAT